MRIDYNKLFFKDTNILYFTTTDTGKKYKAYIAGVSTQTFGGFTYELGVNNTDWMDIYNNLEYAEVKKDKRDKRADPNAKVMTRSAECPVSISISFNSHIVEEITGKVSHFHQKNKEHSNDWFDCLNDKGVIDAGEQQGLRALQISIEWETVEALDKKYDGSQNVDSNIFTKIDID